MQVLTVARAYAQEETEELFLHITTCEFELGESEEDPESNV